MVIYAARLLLFVLLCLIIDTHDSRGQTNRERASTAPIVTAFGSLDASSADQFDPLAMIFPDAPGVPGSGSELAGTVTAWLLAAGFTVIEHSRMQGVMEEQRRQPADEATRILQAGRSAGAKAILLGTVNEWKENIGEPPRSSVTLGVRIIDVDKGTVIFHGHAYYPQPVNASATVIANLLLTNVMAHLMAAINGGWLGYAWKLVEQQDKRLAVITDVLPGTPSERAGLKVGDVIVSCNQTDRQDWHTRRQFYEVCRVEPGQGMLLTIERSGESLSFLMTAIDRRQWYRDRSRIR